MRAAGAAVNAAVGLSKTINGGARTHFARACPTRPSLDAARHRAPFPAWLSEMINRPATERTPSPPPLEVGPLSRTVDAHDLVARREAARDRDVTRRHAECVGEERPQRGVGLAV